MTARRTGRGLRADPLDELSARPGNRGGARSSAAYLRDKYLLRPGLFEAARFSLTSTGTAIAASTLLKIDFSTAGALDYDTFSEDGFSAAGKIMADVPNSKIIIPVSGVYAVSACIAWSADTTGYRRAQLQSNLDGAIGEVLFDSLTGTIPTFCPITIQREFVENEEVTLWGYHTESSSLAPVATSEGTFLAAHWVANLKE